MKYESNVTQNPHNGAWLAEWSVDDSPPVSLGEFPTRTDAERAVEDALARDGYAREVP